MTANNVIFGQTTVTGCFTKRPQEAPWFVEHFMYTVNHNWKVLERDIRFFPYLQRDIHFPCTCQAHWTHAVHAIINTEILTLEVTSYLDRVVNYR